MTFFLNEVSLHGQYPDQNAFISAIRTFNAITGKIAAITRVKEVFKSQQLHSYEGVSGMHFNTALKSNPSINAVFVQNIQRVNPKNWEPTQQHQAASTYSYGSTSYTGSSIAELAERKIISHNLKGVLINFADSSFAATRSILILKNNATEVNLDCASNIATIEDWLAKNDIRPYDTASRIAPTDDQTVLNDSTIFELTDYPRNNGRLVYRRIGTNELWTVDSSTKHAGPKAHIEVFSETTTKHLGTVLYNSMTLNTKFKKPNRTINLL